LKHGYSPVGARGILGPVYVYSKNAEILQFFIKQKCLVNFEKETVLDTHLIHQVVQHELSHDTFVLQALLQHGINIYGLDSNGKTVFERYRELPPGEIESLTGFERRMNCLKKTTSLQVILCGIQREKCHLFILNRFPPFAKLLANFI
jgi:hypothetical protein